MGSTRFGAMGEDAERVARAARQRHLFIDSPHGRKDGR